MKGINVFNARYDPAWFAGERTYGCLNGGELGPVQLTVGLLDPFVGNGAGSMTKLKQYGIGKDVDCSSCYGGGQM